ncbi:hypothetical protein NDU88_004926 [Pleurodeles waltl]|uniref:Uncharacterized protein n=1 Tax=Pleurodeles waltl TaxID=8319 RepID=A0AAV7WWH2_PLEWA|nr:hypothetical protein NDU88_004926 [Pleurodeles waltl]
MTYRHQHVSNTNPEKEISGRKEKACAYLEDGEEAEKTLEEPEHLEKTPEEPEQLEKGGDTGRRRRELDQNYKEAEQRHNKDIEGEQSADDIDKPPVSDLAACHIPGGTWLAQVGAHIRGTATTLFKRGRRKRGTRIEEEEEALLQKKEGTAVRYIKSLKGSMIFFFKHLHNYTLSTN